MGLFDFLGRLISDDAKQRARIQIDAKNDLTRTSGIVAAAEQHYVQLILGEMFLKKNNEWFTSRYPLVYSLIALSYGDQPKIEFSNVSGKNKFEITQADLNRSILRNFKLTPQLPFRGGDVEIDLGLVSMEASNLIQAFAKTVSDIAGALTMAQVSAIANLSSTIAGSVQALLGAGKGQTKLAVHDLLQSNGEGTGSLVSSFILLSGRERRDFSDKTVWMAKDGVRVGHDENHLAALEAQDYLVLEVRLTTSRTDWQSLSAIAKPLDDAIKAKLSGQDATMLLTQAKLAAMTSPDLTRSDAARVITAINKYYSDSTAIMATVETLAATTKTDRTDDAESLESTVFELTASAQNPEVEPVGHLEAAMSLLGQEAVPPLEELKVL